MPQASDPARSVPVGRARRVLSALVVAGLAAGLLAACGSDPPPPPPASLGVVTNQPVPTTTLVNQNGVSTSLAAFKGKYVLMAPFLTLCQEECPMTTGALIAMKRDVAAAGLAGKVQFLEVTVDPWRDTPARLAAYAQRFGANWPLLTGSVATMTAFWHHFGIYFAKVPEGTPPAIDWWTGQPLTFDVQHTDGFVLIDPAGHERFLTVDPVNLHGKLQPDLKKLLNTTGLHNLNHQTSQSWTLPQGLEALGWLVGRTIPNTAGT